MNTLEQKQKELADAKAAVAKIEKEINALTPNGIWVPGWGSLYWIVGSEGKIDARSWIGCEADHYRLSIGNVFLPGDELGPADYIKFMQSIRRTCTYEEANWYVYFNGEASQGKNGALYLLGRCKPTEGECEQWRDEYHEFQLRLCEGPSE